ncbi:MAG: hypothetical protein ACJ8BF_07375 [Gemmatimonadales bacterium]
MAEPSLVDQLATLNSMLRAIEVRLAFGRVPLEGLEDFKSVLDDLRERLWGLLSAAGGRDYEAFQERFRIRRTGELCRGLSGDLRGGSVSGRLPELTLLKDAARELKESIEHVRAHGR